MIKNSFHNSFWNFGCSRCIRPRIESRGFLFKHLDINKTGAQLLEENSLSVLLGVIIMIGFAVGIGLWFRNAAINSENEASVNTLEAIKAKIENLKDGQSNKFVFQGFVAEKTWYIVGYSKKDERPDKCFFESCICISPQPTIESCQSEGYYETFEVEEIETKEIIEFTHGKNFFPKIEEKKFITIPKNLYLLEINKTENKIAIDRHTQEKEIDPPLEIT